MSSPLANLRKTKRGPINSQNRNIPYRYGEDSLLEEVTSRMTSKRHGSPSLQRNGTPDPVAGTPSDIDLMQTMMSRIALVEKHSQLQAKQLQDKDKRINVLEDKCRLYQKLSSEESHSPSYVRDLEARCLSYQQQISEMEDFLLDYGMMWVGDEDEADIEDGGTSALTAKPDVMWDPEKSVPGSISASSRNPYNIDFDRIIENIKELNALAGEGETKIEKTKSGARFKMPDPVQLILFSNGIVMFEGPFRSYEEETTKICMADFTDGYFPSELQSKYPDGVPFLVVDKRTVTFEPKPTVKTFAGQGQSLGGDTQPSRLIPSVVNNSKPSVNNSSTQIESTLPGKKLTADQFLSHLPSSVIRSGRVIDIRNSLAESLKGVDKETNLCPVTIVQTETMQEIKDRLDIEESVRPPSGRNITTLRIKDTDNHTYVLKMKFSDTIGDVMDYLSELRSANTSKYHLVTTFPSKVYDDLTETLFSAGLTPNATMHVKSLK